ncbi:MAG: helicase-related protein [Candidatus Nezhaarchaeota archaeon]|nr:helicase-related protein [Candidatus Nezhaarchaeota archaeon]
MAEAQPPRSEASFVEHPLVKPRAVEDRLYQRRIVERALRGNTLVVLPTALGKTVIAALLTAHRLREAGGKVLFLAPTRPLTLQHFSRFKELLNINEEDMAVLTGQVPQLKRGGLYRGARVIFATPQVVRNDVADGIISLSEVSLIIFDEAHRARGGYAYVEIAKRYVEQRHDPLILALTASPGGDEGEVMQLCRNLFIEAIEVRTDEDEDVAPYIQPIKLTWRKVKLPAEYEKIRSCLRSMLEERVKALQALGLLVDKKPSSVTKSSLLELNEELQSKLERGGGGYLYHVKAQTTAAISIAHMLELLETQGVDTLKAFIEDTLVKEAEGGSRAHRSILSDPLFAEAKFYVKQAEGVKHPKLQALKEVVVEQLRSKPSSRILVFAQYRDTAKVILEELAALPEVKAARFVGQASRGRDEGMSQREQQEILEAFRAGRFNVLVATSIAEEGLDVPEVDHVVFYEPVPSEIRFIQRRGRTGRRVAGKATVLITERSLDEAFYWASVHRVRKMKATLRKLDQALSKLKEGRAQATPPQPSPAGAPRAVTLTSFLLEEPAAQPRSQREPRAEWFSTHLQYAKGMSRALRWLEANLSSQPVRIEELMERALSQGLSREAFEAALNRLLQLGVAYQPLPGLVSLVRKA